jgi:hypothetical protein
VILVRPFTEADDVAGFHAAKGSSPARAARPRTRRWWRAGWGARRWSAPSDAQDRPGREDDLRQRLDRRRGRLHRHRRHQGLRDARGRAADRRARGRVLRHRARVGRRDPALASAPTPTTRRARRRRASWARRASACAGPSTCSWPRTASPRCGR